MIDEFQRAFLPHTERHTLTFDILSDDRKSLQKIIRGDEWDMDEGLIFEMKLNGCRGELEMVRQANERLRRLLDKKR